MITRFGMSEFGMTVTNKYMGGDTSLACSAETSALMVIAVVNEQYEKAKKLLSENTAKLHELASFLYEKETITGEEFMEILHKA